MKKILKRKKIFYRKHQCKICDHSGLFEAFYAQDYNRGVKDKFLYCICPVCGCLQICKTPNNLSEYYDEKYYSFSATQKKAALSNLVANLKKKRDIYEIEKKGFGKIMHLLMPRPSYGTIVKNEPKSVKILDVGCGDGYFIKLLYELGYRNVFGCDLFVGNHTSEFSRQAKVIKGTIFDCRGNYDVITFLHSFEHIENQKETLKEAANKLSPNGKIVISIPVAGSTVFKKYGRYWVQLDAPRHLFLHTEKSITMMAISCGLKIESINYDSTSFQYVGTIQLMKGMNRKKQRTLKGIIEHIVLSLLKYNRLTKKENKRKESDQLTIVFRKK